MGSRGGIPAVEYLDTGISYDREYAEESIFHEEAEYFVEHSFG